MKKIEKTISQFNKEGTLGIISSYPAKSGEVASDNAIERYTHLLTKNLPKNQKVVVFAEKRNLKNPYKVTKNVLVVPSYEVNSPLFFANLISQISRFGFIKNFLIQFEFSIFGGKIVIPQFLLLLLVLKLLGKSVKIMFHQVVNDINTLSGHLAISKNGFKASLFNSFLGLFYSISGSLADRIFVHDELLKARVEDFVDSNKVVIIPHGINIEKNITKKFTKASKKHFGLDSNTKLIGLFGYCSWYKGTDWLIENFAKFMKENPKAKLKLIVAGGQSPTLKGTFAYNKYHKRLMRVIKEANGDIIYTGFVPERDVKKVFAAVDLFIFPYRTKMSASGAFSLCLGFQKPYIVSRAFASNLTNSEKEGKSFPLSYGSFEKALKTALKQKKSGKMFSNDRSWTSVAQIYLKESLPAGELTPKLEYAQAS